MKNLALGLFVAVLLLLSAAAGCGGGTTRTTPPSPIDFHVNVTDRDGNPLPGAKVVSESQPEGQLKLTGLTGADGRVTFDGIKSGGYLFYISRHDYEQASVTMIASAAETELTVKLTPAGTKPPPTT